MTVFTMREAADLLGVSDDTVRRWADSGRIVTTTTPGGRAGIEGRALAQAAQSLADDPDPGTAVKQSARNRMRGVVTRVLKDTVMAQVELQCGPFRVVSLMSREAVDDLGLEVGSVAVASIKSTNVVVGVPR